MSYSYQLKQDLCRKKNKSCCSKAELYAFLLFSNTFSHEKIKATGEHEEILLYYKKMIKMLCGKDAVWSEKGDRPELGKRSVLSSLKLEGADAKTLLEKLNCSVESPLSIDKTLLKNACCVSAFLRGAFISVGFISSPQKHYHLEIVTPHRKLSEDLLQLLCAQGLKAKSTERKGNRVVYIKNGESIKDFLALIGAVEQVFDYTNIAIVRDMRNSVNRIVNCENANIDKTVAASVKHVQAIKILQKRGYKDLTDQLKEIALLRLENDSISLEQLGKLCMPPLSKAGVYHRLKKICEIAEEFKTENNGV